MANSLKKIIPLFVYICVSLAVHAAPVNVNFFVGYTKVLTCTVESGTTFTIPDSLRAGSLTPSSWVSVCRNYTFAGWKAGSRVTSAETSPTLVGDGATNTIVPTYNINLYAVFHNDPAKINSYVRISQTSDLEEDGQYLIVCFYVYGDETQYYAMTNLGGTYKDANGITRNNRANALRLFPRDGVITGPNENLVWTLKPGASSGQWKWFNANANEGSQWLRIGTADQTMFVNAGMATSCIITAANGIFTIRNSASSYQLKYVDDEITEEDDYFITGTFNDYVIYLYKKASPYTSFPDCNPWSVCLNAEDGTIVGTLPAVHQDTVTEVSAGTKVTLPEAEMTTCADWNFYKWMIDEPWEGPEEPTSGLVSAGTYDPLYNGVTLYAIYKKEVTTPRTVYDTTYVKCTGSIQSGKKYIIVYNDGANNYAISNTETETARESTRYDSDAGKYVRDKYYLANKESVVVNGSGIIEGAQSTAIEWTWTQYSGNWGYFQNVGNTSVFINPNRTNGTGSGNKEKDPLRRDCHVLGESNTTYSQWSDGVQKWAIYDYNNGAHNLYYSSDQFRYYFNASSCYLIIDLYEQTITSRTVYDVTTTYTSYPHCTNYTIHLHACGGTIGTSMDQNADSTQTDPALGIKLPSATPACDGWEFVGWFPGEEKESFEHVEFTDFKAAGTPYLPKFNDIHLYAIYKQPTHLYRIIHGPTELADDDEYLVVHYSGSGSKKYDWTLSSETIGSDLKAYQWEAPRDGTGYYILIDTAATAYPYPSYEYAMWRITQSGSYWHFKNVRNNQYLKIGTDGHTSTTPGANNISVTDYDGLAVYITSGSYYLYSDGASKFITTNSDTHFCYIYRRIKEYASWPHCDPFSVSFVACGGTAELPEDATITEPKIYEGVVLPNAYANADCSKEGWKFAGWSTLPINEETNLQTFNLYPAGTVYHPHASHTKLYAVYYQPTNHFKRITTIGRLYTGTNYIIATSGDKALKNMPNTDVDPTSVNSVSVSPDAAHIITVDDPSIEWRLGGVKGAYELYNEARDVYLDLREPQEAHLTKEIAEDNFDITYENDSYVIRSCISIVHYSLEKYLGLSGSNFVTVKSTNLPTLYLYRQQSNYHSYPTCTEDIDVIKWAKEDATYNSVTVESFHLTGVPDVHGSFGTPELQSDGTYKIKFDKDVLTPCSRAVVEWDGVRSRLRIPYIVSADANLNASALLNGTARDCSDCDVYIMPNKTLTVSATDTIRKLYVPDNATLNVANGQTLSVSIFSLFSEGDQAAPQVNLNTSGSIKLRNDELYYDKRIDEDRYYWFSLPFDAQLKEISFVNEAANDGLPQYYSGTDGDNVDRAFFVKYYNGAKRADDANGGALDKTYWTDVTTRGSDYTLKAGRGYEIGLADQVHKNFHNQGYSHTSRTFRFTMRPGNAWLTEETTGSKSAIVNPSTCDREKNAVHAGWNLIGNPYMHTYNTGTVPNDGNIKNGRWVEKLDPYGDKTGYWWVIDEDQVGYPKSVPYLTIYHPDWEKHHRYEQVLASSRNLRPFEAVFVQVNEGNTLNFGTNMSVSALPAYMRYAEEEEPIRTGITLSGADRTDRAGFVLSEEYTPIYEIGADLEKVVNSSTKKGVTTYSLNLYSFNADHQQLAFNGLSPQNALDTIPLGVTLHADGEYTFSFDADWYGVKAKYFESLELIDYQQQTTTNLLTGIYSFTGSANQVINDRFALIIRLKEQTDTPTGLEDIDTESGDLRKIIRDGHMYIIRDHDIYSATGAKVK